ncbi:MAG: hypothetical protein HLUCCO16_06175 [Phormidium sp. OSCR]|nr:MAG: hypothetical protein HLUCCO16_06175 [Phormidium sp. OSCR]
MYWLDCKDDFQETGFSNKLAEMTEILSKNPISLPQFLVSQTSTHPETGFLYPDEPRFGSDSGFNNILVFLSSP